MKIVATSGINSDAAKIKQYINKLSYDIKFIQDYIDYLPNIWSGEDEKQFANKYQTEVLPTLREYEKNFNEYYNFLIKVYDIFKALDANYNKPINTE